MAKRLLFDKKRASDGGGGGSVFFVTKDFHSYLKVVDSVKFMATHFYEHFQLFCRMLKLERKLVHLLSLNRFDWVWYSI